MLSDAKYVAQRPFGIHAAARTVTRITDKTPRILAPALFLVPCVIAVLAHQPAMDNGFTNWDDPMYLLGNELTVDPLAEGVGGLLRTERIGYPVPATVLVYAAERRLFATSGRFGLDPAGFHGVSLALHALAALLLALLALRLGASLLGAVAAASLFAAHPLTVEPVAWVTGQKDLLAATFALAALAIRAGPRGQRAGASIACAALAVLAMASKPSAVALPVLIIGVDLVLERDVKRRGAVALYAVLGALAAAVIAMSLLGHEAQGISPTGSFGLSSLGDAAWTYTLQLGHAAWPSGLVPRYFAPTGLVYAIMVALGVLLATLTMVAAWVAWRRGAHAVAFGIGAALVAYLPTSGLLPLPRGPADSYMYLPLALAAIAVARVLGRGIDITSSVERGALGVIVALVVALGVVASRGQATMWRDSPTLWSELALAYPDEPRALMRVGDAYLFEQQPGQALLLFDDLETRFPEFVNARGGHADALMLTGRDADAERKYAQAAHAPGGPQQRDAYAFFLVSHGAVEPTDTALAHDALRAIAPELAERGKRPTSLARAADLLERYGEAELAAKIRARRAAVLQRNRR